MFTVFILYNLHKFYKYISIYWTSHFKNFKKLFKYIKQNNNFSTLYHSTIWESLSHGPGTQPAKACGSKIPNAKTNTLNHCSLSYPVTSSDFSCFKSSFANPSLNYKFNIPRRFAYREREYPSIDMSHWRTWCLHSSL